MIPRHKRTKVDSIVIVRHSSKGFVAHIRYQNPKYNASIAHFYKETLYNLIEKHVESKCGYLYG